MMVTVIGRGNSGTRAMSHTLSASGVYMGRTNVSGDLIPPRAMYDACRVMAAHVVHRGGVDWDFSTLHAMPIDPHFERLVRRYLASILGSNEPNRGWKIPETTLVYPWIVRMFPDIKYIYWIRDPRDCILGEHLTDDLGFFGIPCDTTNDIRLRRAVSWKYQSLVYKATPKPRHLLEMRFEDLVLDQTNAVARLSAFLGIDVAHIPVRPESVGRWKRAPRATCFDFLEPELRERGYELP